ncbi:DUF6152 family protein [Luteimonas viscosa]|nr:DUF6152 family protein [Luteimonas viscosa]
MRRMMIRCLALAAALCAVPVLAHHGWGSYDAERVMRFDAPLAEVRIANPHAQVVVEHEGKRWDVILAPVSRMTARGMADGALAEGKTVTIEGYPRNDGSPELRAERIVVDGKTIELR